MLNNKSNHSETDIYKSKRISSNSKNSKPFKLFPEPRNIRFENKDGYGFKLTGNTPVMVQSVTKGGSAWIAGLRGNDAILKVNGVNVYNKSIESIMGLLKEHSNITMLVQSYNIPNASTTIIISQQIRKPQNVQKNDRDVGRRKSIPKPISSSFPRPKSLATPESQSSRPITHQPIRHSNISQRKQPTVHTNNVEKSKPVETSSDSSESSSSNGSNALKTSYSNPLLADLSVALPHHNSHQRYSARTSPLKTEKFKTIVIDNRSKPNNRKSQNGLTKQVVLNIDENKTKQHTSPKQVVPNVDENQIKQHSSPKQITTNEDLTKLKQMTKPIIFPKPTANNDAGSRPLKQTNHHTLPIKKVTNDDGMKAIELSKHHTVPKPTYNGRILGREFDDDSLNGEETGVLQKLLKELKSADETLSRPGLIAIVLNVVKEKCDDLKLMLFYYSCNYFKFLSRGREFPINAKRMAAEIITTFLFEKSPLCVNVDTDSITETLKHFQTGEKSKSIFDIILLKVFDRLKAIVVDVRGKLERGIQLSEDISSSINAYNSANSTEKEMQVLYRSISIIINNMAREPNENDLILATKFGLATMYQYFHTSVTYGHSSIRSRSTDVNYNNTRQNKKISICEPFNIPTLCSSPISTKKPKSYNGHIFVYAECREAAECSFCKELLWGIWPQGLLCTVCKDYYHLKCKKKNKNSCARKLRKSSSQIDKGEKPFFLGRLSRKSSTNSNRSPLSAEHNATSENRFFGTNPLVVDDKINSNPADVGLHHSKSRSAEQVNRNTTFNYQFERMGSGYKVNGLLVNKNMDNISLTGDYCTVQVHELIQDEGLNDPDMKISDSFDADFELKSVFPDLFEESDKRILIVLLEFYHKTRYILMNLKRLWYCVVQKWPPSQNVYFKALSLDCISPLIDLIKTLVVTIENCINEQNFIGLEQAVLDWVSDNDEERLKIWLSLCSNLCCTNSLNNIKQLRQNTLSLIPELSNLLKVKFNKRVMIDDLAQIRPLLISLPFIVKNIIKTLGKDEAKYSEEINLWKQISTRLDYLGTCIDRCYMPLVDCVNNGTILRKTDVHIKWKDDENDIRDYYNEFPRTLFRLQIFDFQVARIFEWHTNTDNTLTTHLKKGTEVLLIIYKNFIVVMQKENENFVLKPIKALKYPNEKKNPIITLSSDLIFKNGGREENQFVLTVISNKEGSLLRIGFSRQDALECWLDYIQRKHYSLERSVSLYKSKDDLWLMQDSGLPMSRMPSGLSDKCIVSVDNVDLAVPNNNPQVEDKEVDPSVAMFMSLSKVLTNASEALDFKTALCGILKITENDIPKKLQSVTDDGATLLEELVLVMFLLSQATLQQTHHLLAKCCPKIDFPSDFDFDKVKGILTSNYNILDKWEQSNKIIEEVTVQLRMSPRRSRYEQHLNLESLDESIDHVLAYTNLEKNPVSEDVVVEDDMKEVLRPNNVDRGSYRYSALECEVPAIEDLEYEYDEMLPVSFVNGDSQMEETIILSRAQIVVSNRNSVYSSGY